MMKSSRPEFVSAIGPEFLRKAGVALVVSIATVVPAETSPATTNQPFVEDSVTFTASNDDVTLAGTLTVPTGVGPAPAVLLVPGASPFDRDATIGSYKPFRLLAHELAGRGYVVLRVDDRGMGESSGSKPATKIDDLARDAVAGVRFLKERAEVDSGRIGLIGHSLGGVIAPRAATLSSDIAFVVILAGTGRPAALTVPSAAATQGNGSTALNAPFGEIVLEAMSSGLDSEAAPAEFERRWDEHIKSLTESERATIEPFVEMAHGFFTSMCSAPLFFETLMYDPAPVLQRLDCPVLAVVGSSDPIQVELPFIIEALDRGGNLEFAVEKLRDVNHLLQVSEPGRPDGETNESIAPVVMQVLIAWLARQ